MANFEAAWDDNYEFDAEVWLQFLLSMLGDKEQKERVVESIARKTGLPPEKIEAIIAFMTEFMANQARRN